MNEFSGLNVLEDKSKGLVKLKVVPGHNAKRAFAIQNNVDGRFAPSDMQTVQSIAELMSAEMGPRPNSEVVVGFTEGSILLAGEIARVRRSPFICTTKSQKPANAIIFQEEHRLIGATHNLLAIGKDKNILLVEDEITLGSTIVSVCNKLQAAGYRQIAVLSLVETVNFDARGQIMAQCGITIHSLVRIELK